MVRASELQKNEEAKTIDYNRFQRPNTVGRGLRAGRRNAINAAGGNVDVTFQPEDSGDSGGWTVPLVESGPQKVRDPRTIMRVLQK